MICWGNSIIQLVLKSVEIVDSPGPQPKSNTCSTSDASFPGGKAVTAARSKSIAGRSLGARFRRYRFGFHTTAILPQLCEWSY